MVRIFTFVFLAALIGWSDTVTFTDPPEYVGVPDAQHAVTNRELTMVSSMATTPGGRLWATWYAGISPAEDQNNYVVLSTSGDDGETWEEVLVVDPDWTGSVRAFDPEVWMAPDGALYLFWAQAIGHDGTVAGVWTLKIINPEDGAPQYGQPQRLTDGVMMCKPIVLSSGEWVLPVSTWRTDDSAKMVVSSDQGQTWIVRGACNVPEDVRNFDEHMIVERLDGSLWMLVRTTYGIGESVSTDRGVTWPDLVPSDIPHTVARFFITRLSSGNLLLVKHGPMDEVTGRSHLTAFISTDDGETWSGGLLLDEREGISYPDGQQAGDGTIYITYDYSRTGAKEILFASFREEDAVAGQDVSDTVRLQQLISKGSAAKIGGTGLASFMVLTDSFDVEIFDDVGTKMFTITLTGSGAADGTNLISMTYGNFRTNGNELIVLRDSKGIEYYNDPLTGGSSLARLSYQALESGGRSIAGISTVVGGSNLVVCANPDDNAGTYGYEYDGSIAGAYLDRTVTPLFTTYGRHLPYVSLAAGPDLNSAPGQEWACLGADGWVEIFAETNSANLSIERIGYFNAGPSATEIAATADGQYVVLYSDNTVQFWTLDGVRDGDPIILDTSGTLVGFSVLNNKTLTDLYEAWASSFNLTGSETNDFDGDGFNNLYEYASNGNPTNAADSGYPGFGKTVSADGTNWFEYVYARRTTAGSGLTYEIMQRSDLAVGSWTNTGQAVETGAGALDADFEVVTNQIPMIGKTREFIRHQITR